MTTIKIDAEFSNLVPALSLQEIDDLRSSILRDGCQHPLVLWGEVLIDGHHRYQICQELQKPFQTTVRQFASRDEVKIWIIQNQFARRNLNTAQRVDLALKLEPLFAAQARERKMMGIKQDLPPNLGEGHAAETNHQLAKLVGVGHSTIAMGKRVFAKADSQTRTDLLGGKTSIHAEYVKHKKAKPTLKENPRLSKLGPPCMGIQLAELAVMRLEQIQPDDSERQQAFDYVKKWIAAHETK